MAVAATVALIAILGTIPYIALQLKAVSASLGTILAHTDAGFGTDDNRVTILDADGGREDLAQAARAVLSQHAQVREALQRLYPDLVA